MPLYDYKCDACHTRFEQEHSMTAPPVKVCPHCGQEKVRKILSTGGVMSHGISRSPSGPPPSSPCGMGGCGTGMCGM
ncbi:MAG: zinc ribbon domain-containing protein [Magnetococcales bacterium]|nr:zinc ribbon domain-containing protein [Magnetococcales bacterium]